PRAMTQHEDRHVARLVVGRRERAAEGRADAEHAEEVAGDEVAFSAYAVDPCSDVGRRRERVGEYVRLAEQRFVLRARESIGLCDRGLPALDLEKLVRRADLV